MSLLFLELKIFQNPMFLAQTNMDSRQSQDLLFLLKLANILNSPAYTLVCLTSQVNDALFYKFDSAAINGNSI